MLLVYVHSNMSEKNVPEFAWLKKLHSIFDVK